MPEMLRVALPVLVKVTVWAVLVPPTVVEPKIRLVGDTVAMGAGALRPVPVNGMACGLPLALSVKVIDPTLVPVAVGVKVTETVQDAPAPNVAPQVVVRA